MAEDRKAGVAAVMSTAAAVAAALAYINSRRAEAAPPPGELVLPDEFVQLIIAIAASAGTIDNSIQRVIQELAKLAINVQGWPPNVRHIRTFTIVCAVVGQAYPGSPMTIPSGISLVIKANPINAVGSLIYVATTAAESTNPNSSYPLVPNESVSYALQNAEEVYVSSNIIGSTAIFTAEQEP